MFVTICMCRMYWIQYDCDFVIYLHFTCLAVMSDVCCLGMVHLSIVMLYIISILTFFYSACRNMTYGRNCDSQCGKCANNKACNSKTGECSMGCAPGYSDPYTCKQGEYYMDV